MNDRLLRIGVLHSLRLLRETVGACLNRDERTLVVGMAPAVEVECRALCAQEPDVILLEWDGTGHAHEMARQIRAWSPSAKILMMGVPETDADIMACIESAGAAAYLLQSASLEDLTEIVDALSRGETVCSPRIAQLLFSRVRTLSSDHGAGWSTDEAGLTPREREIIGLIEKGLCNKEIAVSLRIEVQTVKNHVHNILDKLHVQDRQAAARYARAQGLVVR